MVALTHWVCLIFFGRGLLIFWPLFSVWYFHGIISEAFLLAVDWLLLPPQWPIIKKIHSTFTALGVWESGVCSLGGLWNAEVFFHLPTPSSLIGKVLALVPFCVWLTPYSRVLWSGGTILELFRLKSVSLMTWSTIKRLSSSSALCEVEVLCCLFWHIFFRIGHSILSLMAVRGNLLRGVRSASVKYFGLQFFLRGAFLNTGEPALWLCWRLHFGSCSAIHFWVAFTDSMNRDLNWDCTWCNLWGMKLNESKTETMIVSTWRTIHPQSSTLTLDRTVLKKSNEFVTFGVTIDAI